MKKNNYFLLALSVFLVGGGLLFSQPAEVVANVACGTGLSCESRIHNQNPTGIQAQVRGHVLGSARNNQRINVGAGIRLGTRSTGTTTANCRDSLPGIMSVNSAWLDDLNNTSDIAVFGHVRTR